MYMLQRWYSLKSSYSNTVYHSIIGLYIKTLDINNVGLVYFDCSDQKTEYSWRI